MPIPPILTTLLNEVIHRPWPVQSVKFLGWQTQHASLIAPLHVILSPNLS